ncbi:transmembrane protein 81 [Hyla sarda]|uniref:transmembrane protein 81 n=1 Tax=Hyla sarda TaxID=327740 RepID=UPI0024C4164E|nr:transmembrane protein 81 [Hyla sarda]
MDFSRRQGMIILSFLFEMTSCSAQDLEKLRAVTIPRELESVSVRAVLESTECSVTCGIGSKKEKRCLVDRSGIQDCEEVIVDCFNNWQCGMEVYTVKVGDHFTMDCRIPSTGTLGGNKHYYWKIARGIVSNNEQYFRPLKIRNSTIIFESIQEKNAGTYCCDVHREDDLKLVKRIFFAVRIFTPDIIDINYDKYVISKQKLAVMAEGLTTEVGEQKVISNEELYTYVGIGSAVGLLAGVVILLLIRRTCRAKVEDNTSKL